MTPPNKPNSSPDLLPCPFCGAPAAYLKGRQAIACTSCLAEGPATTPEGVAQEWNRRAKALSSKNELPSEIEGLVERLQDGDDLHSRIEAAQAILSLQRRLESVAQFALDLAGGRVMGDGLDELRRRADAALNPKDTGHG
jgi:hypothetical protein